ncbi:hypothetical protein [Luethyella okanaganae]|uniref:Uncharacterized protein n=1 Tax=Luethyella okanaganae TaxID=69372 RepID=A0ABW1VCU8_9MICO
MTGHPELELADDGDHRPLRSERMRRITRFVVLLGLTALILPTILTTLSVTQASANRACAVATSVYRQDAAGSTAGFELFGPGGPGWQCYWISGNGVSSYLLPLGLVPSVPREPPARPTAEA